MNVYPNAFCPCGSSKKYKKCCMNKSFSESMTLPDGCIVDFDDYSRNFMVNRKGAVIFNDESKQPVLDFSENQVTKNVLSVGISRTGKAMATILDVGRPVCYFLPDWYYDWCLNHVMLSQSGVNLFPSDVIFGKIGDRYFAEML